MRRRALIEKRETKRKGAWREGPDDELKIRREQSGRLVQWCHVTGSGIPSSPPRRRLPRNLEESVPGLPLSSLLPSFSSLAVLCYLSLPPRSNKRSNNGRLPSLSDSLSMSKETSGHHERRRQWISAFKARCRDTMKIIRADLLFFSHTS